MRLFTIIVLSSFFLTLAHAEEMYLAKFQTLNGQINGVLAGSATIWINENKITAYTRLFAGFPNAWHMQNVYLGKRCPVPEDDLNQDGIIDIDEGAKVWGNVIVPLDGDLNSQDGGANVFPKADIYGAYFYEVDGDLPTMLKDLKQPDPRTDDNVSKLAPNEKLSFNGKVVVINGIDPEHALPETVQTWGDLKAPVTLPIACGVLQKIK